MRIRWVEGCRGMRVHPIHGTDIFGIGVETQAVESFPARVEFVFAVALGQDFYAMKARVVPELSVSVVAPDLTHLGSISATSTPIEPENPDRFREGYEATIIQPITIKLEVTEPGPFLFTFQADDDEPVTATFHVILASSL